MESLSNKCLWSLVSGDGIQTEKGILESELLAQEIPLCKGILEYKPPNKDTKEAFAKNKEVGDSWRDFVTKLSTVLNVEENGCWNLLCSYLASEFRGTSDSLLELLKDDLQVKPLLFDIWQFYRAERVYSLQILKCVLSSACEPSADNAALFTKVLERVDDGGLLKESLIKQFSVVLGEKAPCLASFLGPALDTSLRQAWHLARLREQAELLQLLLLYLHHSEEKTEADFLRLAKLFSSHDFGATELESGQDTPAAQRLTAFIGTLEGALLVLLLDLASIPSSSSHPLFPPSGPAPEVERLVSGLGSQPQQAPPMLAFMLGCFLSQGQEGLVRAGRQGEEALALGVLTTLNRGLQGELLAHSPTVASVLHSLTYTMLSALLSAFEPRSLGLACDTQSLVVLLLKHPRVTQHFWKAPQGLSLYVDELKAEFPYSHAPLLEVCCSLASASLSSCSQLLPLLSSLPSMTVSLPCPSLPSAPPSSSLTLSSPLFPLPGTQSLALPPGTVGQVSPSGTSITLTPPPPHTVNGWQVLLADMALLVSQASQGQGNIQLDTQNRVSRGAELVAAVLKTDPSLGPQLAGITNSLLSLLSLYSQFPDPPLPLLAAITSIFSSLALESPGQVLRSLSPTLLLPFLKGSQLYPGVVGSLLAQQETVQGDFPCLTAFLHLCKATAGDTAATPLIMFIAKEVIPQLHRWRYSRPSDRELVASLCLSTLLTHLLEGGGEEGVLLSSDQGLAHCLLNLASTGDRAIQALLETEAGTGRGEALAEVVMLALSLLHTLVTTPSTSSLVLSGPLGSALRSPPSSLGTPHLLLTLAHYTHYLHSPLLPVAAVRLLTALACNPSSSVSVLACLAGAAPAVRDMLLLRLESSTEDMRLKVAIIDLLTACVDHQPGMVQLLMGINTELRLETETDKGKEGDTPTQEIVGEGCLAPVLKLLELCNVETAQGSSSQWLDLHHSIVKLIDSLWSRGRILATQHLKSETGFWSTLCHPLTSRAENTTVDKNEARLMKIKASVLRIVSHEIYTWTGKLSKGLGSVIEKICDEKSVALTSWCDVEDEGGSDATTIEETQDSESDNIPLQLLSAWRAFFLLLSKDCPSTLSPSACRAVFLATTGRLSWCLAQALPPPRLTPILAETAAVLARRWQTKTTDSMDTWCQQVAKLLERLDTGWKSVHPRARLAILALSITTLKVSNFKLELREESSILSTWLPPALSLLSTSLRELPCPLPAQHSLSCPELLLSLLQGLLTRLPPSCWLPALHSNASLPMLLSAPAPLLTTSLPLLQEVAATPSGCAALLLQDLNTSLWLPLSSLQPDATWLDVRQAALELAASLLRQGKRQAVSTAVTAAALLSDRIAGDLLSPRQDLANLGRAARSLRFVSALSTYSWVWHSEHPASLMVLYRACCHLAHTCTSLLIRPSLLSSLVKGKQGEQQQSLDELKRVRKMSTASCTSEIETVEGNISSEAAPAYTHMLDICLACVTLFSSLSPPLEDLMSGAAMHDPDRWQPLFTLSFSAPALELPEGAPCPLSYGTLLSLANLCVRSLAKDSVARSPSPGGGRSRATPSPIRGRPPSAPPPDTPSTRRLWVVLERSLCLLLQQGLLAIARGEAEGEGGGGSARELQLLRRELGAELGSIADTWRRHLHRQERQAHPTGKSPQPPASPSPQPGQHRGRSMGDHQAEAFMKTMSSIIHNVFK